MRELPTPIRGVYYFAKLMESFFYPLQNMWLGIQKNYIVTKKYLFVANPPVHALWKFDAKVAEFGSLAT